MMGLAQALRNRSQGQPAPQGGQPPQPAMQGQPPPPPAMQGPYGRNMEQAPWINGPVRPNKPAMLATALRNRTRGPGQMQQIMKDRNTARQSYGQQMNMYRRNLPTMQYLQNQGGQR